MSDQFFEGLDKEFGDLSEPITEPDDRIGALHSLIKFFNNALEHIDNGNFIEDYATPDPSFRDAFRESIEFYDRLSNRLLEGIKTSDSPELPERIDLGNTTNPEEPIRDPLLRIAGFEALRFYLRFILEEIAEGEFSERINSLDSAEFIRILRNTFLSLGILVIRLYEGLEAEQ